ncbi:uncharacterized protein B0I36DRAFT_322288 [Microdochium trichocladiopsis]|uniref:Uncharacterized protein n=1 Tax=Microdochium trichocladiopsis TaxID=1682393 RepID=A0A9P8Y8F7_9PEZI|nr:uncharacterized protein B0I36DRAFT_322288 [Microdochium trichocladiopsis]KAH7030704.1 hypothetical protein B0I36DRAFT_322288 [Microdochium trichocladiopsis]
MPTSFTLLWLTRHPCSDRLSRSASFCHTCRPRLPRGRHCPQGSSSVLLIKVSALVPR